MRYPTPADTAASTGEALAREKVTKISSNFLLPLSDQAHVLRNAENRRQRRRLSRGHRRGKLILWCNKNLGTIYLYIWDFRKGQNMVQRMSLGLYPSTPQPFRESFVKMWNCWISKCWWVALIVFSSRLSPLLLSLQLRQFAFLGAFPAGSQRLLHRVFKATHATRVAGCITVCDATWHTGGLPDTMAFFHPTALAGQSSQRAESQEAETQEDLRMCFQDMKSSIFLLCHLSFLHLLHHIWPEYHLRN